MSKNAQRFGGTVVLCIVISLAMSPTNAFAAEDDYQHPGPSRQIESEGQWTLDQLGYDSTTLELDGGVGSESFEFVAPAGSAQGPDEWWQLSLALSIEVDRSVEGKAILSASTGGKTAAQMIVTIDSDGLVQVEQTDLVNGTVRSEYTSDRIDIRFKNYLRLGGVAPGPNALVVKAESVGGSQVLKMVEVDNSSAISRDSNSPFDVALDVRIGDTDGRRTMVHFTVHNYDREPAKGMGLTVTIEGAASRASNVSLNSTNVTEATALQSKLVIPLGDVATAADGAFIVDRSQPGQDVDLSLELSGTMRNDSDRASIYLAGVKSDTTSVTALALAFASILVGSGLFAVGSRRSRQLGQ